MNDGYDRFIGAFPRSDNWTAADCQWTRYQYLCPQETGAGFACGTIIPGSANFKCSPGYTPTADRHCRPSPPIERPCNCPDDGRTNPTTKNPIVISTGAKSLSAQDYQSGDGQFAIGREYRSFQVGRPIDTTILPRGNARGLAGGWNFDFATEIQLGTFSGSPTTPTAKVAILMPDGSGYSFVLQSSGLWMADPSFGAANASAHLKLDFVGTLPVDLSTIKTAASTWKLTDRNDAVWTLQTRVGSNGGSYNTGYPTQKVQRDNYSWAFTYNADSSLATITDSFNRTATFTWEKFFYTSLASPPAGSLPFPTAVRSIALPDGTSLKYTYDPPPAASAPSTSMIERLVKVERLSAASAVLDSVTYHHEDARFRTHVTGITDNRAVRTRTYTYDAQGRATSSQGPGGAEAQTIEFGTSGTSLTRRITGPLGKAENYTFASFTGGLADYRLTQVAGEASANTPASTSALGFATDTYINSQTDAEGRVTNTTARDARGRPLTVIEAVGTPSQRTTTINWHPTWNAPQTITRPGLTESRAYTPTGQLASVTLTDTTSQTVPYSTNGQTRATSYTWSAAGRLLSINGPLAAVGANDDLTTFAYTAQGNLQTVTDPLGHVTTYAGHDANGRPASMTDWNGIVTGYTYDPLGRIASITVQHPTDPLQNAVTSFGYDAIGQLISLTLPSTETLTMDYDAAGRLTALRAANGERRNFVYDAMGNVTSETDKRADTSVSRQITRTFDELGRIIGQVTGPGRTPAKWAYDKVGNPVTVTSPNGNSTTAAFDALDRVTSTVAPDTGQTTLAYDPRDNLTGHTDPVLVATQFTYNGFNEVIQEMSPDRGTSIYWYDAAGRLTQAQDARGQIVTYTYDWLGRVTSKTPVGRPASEVVSYTWDAGALAPSYPVGRLTLVTDGTGVTMFGYDHRGNLTGKKQTIGTAGATLGYTYDLADQVTQIDYPSGRQVAYAYDTKGRVASVQTRASSAIPAWTPVSSAYTYEPFGVVRTMALGNGLAVANDNDASGRLASRRLYRASDNTSLSHLTYGYDAEDNIASITNQLSASGSALYGYDKTGRLSLTVVDAATLGPETLAYTSGTNRLASVTGTGGTRAIAYDARGNTASETRPGGIAASTSYDGYARLTGYTRTDAGALTFAYNGLDDRVAMTLPASTRRFVYDASGRAMGEYGASASDVKAEFIWMLPEVAASSTWGGDDGLGGYMPLAVATPDSGGAVVLNWVHGSHLGVPLVITDATGNPATTPNDYLAPGFPGQARVLPDLYYNRYRDFDPATGRYVQADPIGLGGGSNLYGYAAANPLNLSDPLGLSAATAAPIPWYGQIPWWLRIPLPRPHPILLALCLTGDTPPKEYTVRVQLQGTAFQMDRSRVLHGNAPITGVAVKAALNALRATLSRRERDAAVAALTKAFAWIDSVVAAGGTGHTKRSFTGKGVSGDVLRADIEILRGHNIV